MEENELLKLRPTPKESKWKIEKRELLNNNPWYSFVHDAGKTDKKKPFDYYYVQLERGAGVIAKTAEGKLLLIRQFRYPTNRESLEVPGGSASENETTQDVASRELLEETGYEAESLLLLGDFDVANGYSNEIADVYLASGCKKVKEQDLEASEEGMTVELFDVEEVFAMIQDKKITDGFTLASLMLAWPHLL